jgi:hypothetical protein
MNVVYFLMGNEYISLIFVLFSLNEHISNFVHAIIIQNVAIAYLKFALNALKNLLHCKREPTPFSIDTIYSRPRLSAFHYW